MKKYKIICCISLVIAVLLIGCTKNSNFRSTSGGSSGSEQVVLSDSKDASDVKDSEVENSTSDNNNQNENSDDDVIKIKSEKDAISSVQNVLGKLPQNYKLSFDHIVVRENKRYYVIHFYEDVLDNPDTGEGHMATIAWYMVEEKTGIVYLWDLIEDKLSVAS